MTTTRWMITSLFALAAPLGLLACDDGDDDAGDEAVESGDESTGGDSEGDETLGRTDVDAGADVGVDEGSQDFGEADAVGDSDEPMGCAVHLDKADCDAASGCASVLGNAILPEGDGWCSAPETEYIGCVNTGDLCPPLTKVLCGGDQMWTTTDCVPDTLTVCEAPGDITGICGDPLLRI